MSKALMIIDMQNDFVTGSLLVPGAKEIIPYILQIIPQYSNIVFTQDYHPWDHKSFIPNGGIFPRHCEKNTDGAEILKEIREEVCSNSDYIIYSILKGIDSCVEQFSAFFDEVGKNCWKLDEKLKEVGIDELDVCGVATEYCVKATVLDALNLGFRVNLLTRGIRGVNREESDKAIYEMSEAGAVLII